MNIAFLGMGKYGQALASLVSYNGLALDYAEIAEKRMLSQPAEVLFLTVPAQFMRAAITANRQYIGKDCIIVNCTKGIEEGSHLFAHQIVTSISNYRRYYSLIGPSFAEGIVAQEPTIVSLGYKDVTHVKTIVDVLQTPYFRLRPSKGFRALELASALKNLYAIACGYAQGLGFGPNTRVRLITMALDEFQTLAKAMHFADYDLLAPGVVGDLVLTCSSEQSRNFSYGLQLAQASPDVKAANALTVEGYHTSHSINHIAQQHGAKLPLAELTSHIIAGELTGTEAFIAFLADYN